MKPYTADTHGQLMPSIRETLNTSTQMDIVVVADVNAHPPDPSSVLGSLPGKLLSSELVSHLVTENPLLLY